MHCSKHLRGLRPNCHARRAVPWKAPGCQEADFPADGQLAVVDRQGAEYVRHLARGRPEAGSIATRPRQHREGARRHVLAAGTGPQFLGPSHLPEEARQGHAGLAEVEVPRQGHLEPEVDAARVGPDSLGVAGGGG